MEKIKVHCAYDEMVDISKLIPNPRKPNQHSDRQIELLAKIIENQGWRVPITVSKRSGFVVRGHGRLMAAEALGLDEVPVDYQDYSNEAEEWADLIADNRLAELSEMDNTMLKDLIQEIDTGEIDLTLTGFDESEIEEMMLQIREVESEGERGGHYNDDEMPEIEPLKLAYRLEAMSYVAEKKKCIELFAGRGALTYWYKRNFEEVVTNDKQKFENVQHDYNLTAEEWIKTHLRDHMDFNFIDFDDEGNPSKEIRLFFKEIEGKKTEAFVLAVTDGNGLNLKS